MRAVWSFWSKPFRDRQGICWASTSHHFLSWVLSVQSARQHFETTELVTDEYGADVLINKLGLSFNHVSTELESLRYQDSRFWVLGKLLTYSMQVEPFVHIDSDVYLWDSLPRRILNADILGQNLEHFEFERDSWYKPQRLAPVIRRAGGWIPQEWAWYVAQRGHTAVCCGIFGGNNISFIRRYAEKALAFATHPRNYLAWAELPGLADHCVLLEQYLLYAMLLYHNRDTSDENRVDLQCLFGSMLEDGNGLGYTHLMGALKRNPRALADLEDMVRQISPDSFNRCFRYLSTLK